MTASKSAALAVLVSIALAPDARAQQPPRPTETPRAVALTLAQDNRLIVTDVG